MKKTNSGGAGFCKEDEGTTVQIFSKAVARDSMSESTVAATKERRRVAARALASFTGSSKP